MTTISCRVPQALAAALAARARERRVSKAVVIREALARAARRGAAAKASRAFELARALCGVLHGPADLSSNSAYLNGLGG